MGIVVNCHKSTDCLVQNKSIIEKGHFEKTLAFHSLVLHHIFANYYKFPRGKHVTLKKVIHHFWGGKNDVQKINLTMKLVYSATKKSYIILVYGSYILASYEPTMHELEDLAYPKNMKKGHLSFFRF